MQADPRTRLAVSIAALLVVSACQAVAPAPHPAPVPAAWSEASPPSSAAPARDPAAPSAAREEQDAGHGAGHDAALKQANNPLANMKALNFHNYYVPEVSGTDDSANQFWVRYAQPISTGVGDWLFRASVPLATVPTGMQQNESGLGDSNAFAAYLFDTGNPSVSLGLGPILGIPTGSNDALGTDQWSAGLAAVGFDARSALFQYGGLVTYQHKIAGSGRDPDVNLLAVQPFGILQLGGGLYLRSVGIWAFDLEQGNYSVPIGMGLGRVVKVGGIVLNFFAEPQFTVLQEGPGQPEFQVFFGFNTQFPGG